MRAYLIVRLDSPAAIDASLGSGADGLVLDLAGIGASARTDLLGTVRRRACIPLLCLCAGTVDAPGIDETLSAAMSLRPDAIMVPVTHGRDIAHLGARLAVHEAEYGWPDGAIRIVALVASAAGALNAGSLAGVMPAGLERRRPMRPESSLRAEGEAIQGTTALDKGWIASPSARNDGGGRSGVSRITVRPRLAGLGWDAGAVAAELHARPLDDASAWSAPLAQVRSLVRLSAAAAGVEAIEAAYPGDERGFARHLAAARRDGFGAVLATSPAQIPLIHEA